MLRALAVTVIAFASLAGLTFAAPVASADSTYEVQDGDTLLFVAAKLGVPNSQWLDWVASTVKLNSMSDADSLKLGQVLKLPSSSPSVAVSQTTSTTTSASKPSTTASGVYAVQDGDTLLAIASKLGISADQQPAWLAKVLTLNGLASAEQLAAGKSLQLPPDPNAAPVTSPSPTSVAPATPSAPVIVQAASTSSTTGTLSGSATSYADYFTGRMMGCMGAGPYSPTDVSIIAVGPAMHAQFPCGTKIEVCGPKGCLTGVRKDSCPGCLAYHVDLSKAGLAAVCGPTSCDVRVRRLP
jgi:LysM repeat protein